MSSTAEELVSFDVLLRSPAAGKTPSTANIEEFRPPAEKIERIRSWFAKRGVDAYPIEFGLACRSTRKVFELLFRVSLKPVELSPGRPPFEIVGHPEPPKEIAQDIEQVTISAPPEIF